MGGKAKFHQFLDFLRSAFSKLPVFGPLAYCTWADHKACFREMLVIIIFSTASFWLTSAILMGHAPMRALGYEEVLLSTVRNGELFIFTVGFIGPILLHASGDKFPGRLWHLLPMALLGILAPVYHSQAKLAQLSGKVVPEDMQFLFHISIFLAAVAVILRYLAMVYKKSTEGFKAEEKIKNPENDFAAAYAEHRAQGSPE